MQLIRVNSAEGRNGYVISPQRQFFRQLKYVSLRPADIHSHSYHQYFHALYTRQGEPFSEISPSLKPSSKTFKKVTGLTPTQYRKSNTENYYKRDTDPHQKEKM